MIGVEINKPNIYNRTPLYYSCYYEHIGVLEYILASGRDVNLSENEESAIAIAREKEGKEKENWEKEEEFQARKINCSETVQLFESFQRNPNETRLQLRIQLGFTRKLIFFDF